MMFHPSTCFCSSDSSSRLSGGTPPRQGTHVLAPRLDILELILPSVGERVSPRPSRLFELFGMRRERVPREIELVRVYLKEYCVRSSEKMSPRAERSARKAGRRAKRPIEVLAS